MSPSEARSASTIAEPAVVGRADVDLRQLRECRLGSRRLRCRCARAKRSLQARGRSSSSDDDEPHLRRCAVLRQQIAAEQRFVGRRRFGMRRARFGGPALAAPSVAAVVRERRRETPRAAAAPCRAVPPRTAIGSLRTIAGAVRVQRQRGQPARLAVAGDVGAAEVVAVSMTCRRARSTERRWPPR